jgi:Na+-driven multidrug efflux pump
MATGGISIVAALLAGTLIVSWILPLAACVGPWRSAAAASSSAPEPSAEVASSHHLRALVRAQAGPWLRLAVPVAASLICQSALTLTDISVLGHLQADYRYANATATDFLAAASLAYSWMFSLNIIIFAGFTSAISVLCSQAFGAQNSERAVQVLAVGAGSSLLACVPVGVGQFFTADAVHRFLPGNASALRYNLISTFSRTLLYSLPSRTMISVLSNFLASAEVVRVPLIIAATCVVLNVAINIVLVHGVGSWHGLGFRGSPIATSITSWGNFVMLAVYTFYGAGNKQHRACRAHWLPVINEHDAAGPPHSPAHVQEPTRGAAASSRSLRLCSRALIREYVLEQALPLAAGGAFEEWQVQVITFFAGSLGAAAVATHNGLMNCFLTISSINYVSAPRATVRTVQSILIIWIDSECGCSLGLVCRELCRRQLCGWDLV